MILKAEQTMELEETYKAVEDHIAKWSKSQTFRIEEAYDNIKFKFLRLSNQYRWDHQIDMSDPAQAVIFLAGDMVKWNL